jgi:hypothetical protein
MGHVAEISEGAKHLHEETTQKRGRWKDKTWIYQTNRLWGSENGLNWINIEAKTYILCLWYSVALLGLSAPGGAIITMAGHNRNY